MRQAVLIGLDSIAPETPSWLWYPYIPIGKLTLLEGDPAAGKTWIALAIASAVSRGEGLPGDVATGHTLYLTAEDGLGDTLRPRLDTVRANTAAITALVGVVPDGGFTLADRDVLIDALDRTSAILIVIDPLQGYLGAKVDMYRANEVRPLMAGLARMAAEKRCAVLVIRHLAKSEHSRTLYRGLGSIDFTAAARSVLMCGIDPEGGGRFLVHTKSSLTATGPSLEYEIDRHGFRWAGESPVDARDLGRSESEAQSRVEAAQTFLASQLARGPIAQQAIEAAARAAGVSSRTLYRAKTMLEVKSVRTEDQWLWSF